MDLKDKKINFLGDSITQGVGTSSLDKRFTDLIAKDYGAVCRNYGISGTRIARQQNGSDPNDYCARFSAMDDDADYVVVFGGTNDFGHGDAPIGSFDDRTVDTFCGAVHTLFSGLIEKYPFSKIAILTPLHRCNEDNPKGDGNKPYNVGVLKDYVDIIRKIAEYYSLPVLDLYACSGLQPKIPVIKETYMPDGLHPSDAGYRILADKIAKFLISL